MSGRLAKMPDSAPAQTGPLLYFNVAGRLAEAADIARAAGGRVLAEPHPIGPHGRRAVILDSEGTRVARGSHGPPAPGSRDAANSRPAETPPLNSIVIRAAVSRPRHNANRRPPE